MKIKLKTHLKINGVEHSKDNIYTKSGNYYVCKTDMVIDANFVEDNPHIFEPLKPLFYTEDFKDGSFPKKNCSNCNTRPITGLCVSGDCAKSGSWQYWNWNGQLQGEPIYEGVKCWKVGLDIHKIPYIKYGNWSGSTDDTLKYFLNEVNAKIYYNQLKWKNKLRFKIGDTVKISSQSSVYYRIITDKDYLNECYCTNKLKEVIKFNQEKYWELEEVPTAEEEVIHINKKEKKKTKKFCDLLNKIKEEYDKLPIPDKDWGSFCSGYLTNLEEMKKEMSNLDKIKRVVVVSKRRGRVVDNATDNVKFALQDNETTLKIFIT